MKPYFGVGNMLDSTFLLWVKPTSPTHRAESGSSQPHGNPLSIVHIMAQRGVHPCAKERMRWLSFDSSKIDLHNVMSMKPLDIFNPSSCVSGDQKLFCLQEVVITPAIFVAILRYPKPQHDLFLDLTKYFLHLNLTKLNQTISTVLLQLLLQTEPHKVFCETESANR